MNLLLDTHTLLWFESGYPRLSPMAKQVILDPANIKFISMAVYWEIAIKNSLGKLELHVSFDEVLTLKGYSHLHISGEHLKLLHTLPFHHRDPFDRLLIAQSLHENAALVGADAQFDLYGVRRIW